MNSLEELTSKIDEVEFHDLPVESFKFEIDKESVEILVSKHCESCDDYHEVLLSFSNVDNMNMGSLANMMSLSIKDYEIEQANEGFQIQLVGLISPSLPEWMLSFQFKSYSIEWLKKPC